MWVQTRQWRGAGDVNSRSIGVELVNSGAEPFAAPQMAALERLLADLMHRHALPPEAVIGHSDMAPDRKSDPGPRFDWRRLALSGLSVWPEAPDDAPGQDRPLAASLRAFGYPDGDEALLLSAFRLRFRPWADGPADRVDAALAADLARRFPVDRARGSV